MPLSLIFSTKTWVACTAMLQWWLNLFASQGECNTREKAASDLHKNWELACRLKSVGFAPQRLSSVL